MNIRVLILRWVQGIATLLVSVTVVVAGSFLGTQSVQKSEDKTIPDAASALRPMSSDDFIRAVNQAHDQIEKEENQKLQEQSISSSPPPHSTINSPQGSQSNETIEAVQESYSDDSHAINPHPSIDRQEEGHSEQQFTQSQQHSPMPAVPVAPSVPPTRHRLTQETQNGGEAQPALVSPDASSISPPSPSAYFGFQEEKEEGSNAQQETSSLMTPETQSRATEKKGFNIHY